MLKKLVSFQESQFCVSFDLLFLKKIPGFNEEMLVEDISSKFKTLSDVMSFIESLYMAFCRSIPEARRGYMRFLLNEFKSPNTVYLTSSVALKLCNALLRFTPDPFHMVIDFVEDVEREGIEPLDDVLNSVDSFFDVLRYCHPSPDEQDRFFKFVHERKSFMRCSRSLSLLTNELYMRIPLENRTLLPFFKEITTCSYIFNSSSVILESDQLTLMVLNNDQKAIDDWFGTGLDYQKSSVLLFVQQYRPDTFRELFKSQQHLEMELRLWSNNCLNNLNFLSFTGSADIALLRDGGDIRHTFFWNAMCQVVEEKDASLRAQYLLSSRQHLQFMCCFFAVSTAPLPNKFHDIFSEFIKTLVFAENNISGQAEFWSKWVTSMQYYKEKAPIFAHKLLESIIIDSRFQGVSTQLRFYMTAAFGYPTKAGDTFIVRDYSFSDVCEDLIEHRTLSVMHCFNSDEVFEESVYPTFLDDLLRECMGYDKEVAEQFFRKVKKANDQTHYEPLDLSIFYLQHAQNLKFILDVLGFKRGVSFLTSFIANTPKQLARFLSQLPIFSSDFKGSMVSDLHDFCNRTDPNQGESKVLFDYLALVSHIAALDLPGYVEFHRQMIALFRLDAFDTFMDQFKKLVLLIFEEAINSLLFSDDIQVDPEKIRIDFLNLVQICRDQFPGRLDFMKIIIMYEMARHPMSFLEYVSSKDDSECHELVRQLRGHNEGVCNELGAAGLDVHSYLTPGSFPSQEVVYTPQEITRVTQADLLQQLVGHLRMLAAPVESNEKATGVVNRGILAVEEALSNPEAPLDRLYSAMKPIQRKVPKLMTSAPDVIKRRVAEFVGHVVSDVSQIRTFKPEAATDSAHDMTFVIRPWDREPGKDIYLGEQVGCCLSPNGGQFGAILERLVDVGMTVIKVENTVGETVSLAWCYLAINEENNDLIFVVNFHEMRAKESFNKELQKFLVSELNAYIAKYAQFLGCKHLFLSELKYGSIPNELIKRDLKTTEEYGYEHSLKKIGGYFIPESAEEYGDDDYYIASLDGTCTFYMQPLLEPDPGRPEPDSAHEGH